MTRKQFIQGLKDKRLVFGWYNGEFVTVDKSKTTTTPRELQAMFGAINKGGK